MSSYGKMNDQDRVILDSGWESSPEAPTRPWVTKLVQDKGPRIDTTRFNPKDYEVGIAKVAADTFLPSKGAGVTTVVNGAWKWNNQTQSYDAVPVLNMNDEVFVQEETPHYTFPNHKAGPVTTVTFDGKTEPNQDARPPLTEFERGLKNLLNKYSMENDSNTPDFILAEYMHACLVSFNIATRAREHWYGRRMF